MFLASTVRSRGANFALVAFATLALSATPVASTAQAPGQLIPQSPTRIAVKILGTMEGMDPRFIGRLMTSINLQWDKRISKLARAGQKGKLIVSLAIQKDGTLAIPDPAIELSSGDKDVDAAAIAAIRAAAPFEPLPKSYAGPDLEMRCALTYDFPPPDPPVPPARYVPINPGN
jgi:TonB family protein